jgi:hypothetical protein
MLIEDGYVHRLHALLQKISADDGARSSSNRTAAPGSMTQRIYGSVSNLTKSCAPGSRVAQPESDGPR